MDVYLNILFDSGLSHTLRNSNNSSLGLPSKEFKQYFIIFVVVVVVVVVGRSSCSSTTSSNIL